MNEKEIIDNYLKKKIDQLRGLTVGLVGDLGSGKTYLVKKILTNLSKQFKYQVSSPTFNLCNIYQSKNLVVNHYDLYRMEREEDLYQIGLWESIDNSQILKFIEWVNLYPEVRQFCDHVISISVDANDKRFYLLNDK